MDARKLAHFKERLLDDRDDMYKRLANNEYGLNESLSESIVEFSTYDNHPADIGTETFEREKDFSLRALDRETLREIEQALDQIEKGTYGLCTVCGQPIDEARLEARPQSLTCKEHAPQPQINIQRPVEEDFLKPPFGRRSMDERDDYNGFDAEDAWQIVEAWGTSSTPFSYVDQAKLDYKEMYIESDEPDGYVEPVEQIAFTDIHGYHGADSVGFLRSGTYQAYIDRGEGKGYMLDYDDYLDERVERESRNDLM
ncbi:TraR/DksA C4-type zinc finger protein [Brevibacillus dissolubilis]|uniref:TraR/DksA C4-type zinc finger protein n=1 Tax=Brevibacillus dissolubilis TaxID=1844116 RepID=UPI00111641A8|nr:TraR/DksA C4-type zinc finger protein [Brevibacillus dissolubilis]